MLGLLVAWNFAISWLNAWACGKSWPESKQESGWPHFMNWMGAVMSACGFTWCYLVVMTYVGINWDVTNDKTGLVHPLISPATAALVFKLGYVVIIGPILGSGLAITVQSWAHFWRRRTFSDGGITAYNTFAQINNTYNALTYVPEFVGDLIEAFAGKSSSKDGKSGALVIFLVVVALLGGILTTYAILVSSAKSHAFALRMKAENVRLGSESART